MFPAGACSPSRFPTSEGRHKHLQSPGHMCRSSGLQSVWPEPTPKGWCASRSARDAIVATQGRSDVMTRACPQSSEAFLSDSIRDSFTVTSSPSEAQSRDTASRTAATRPVLSSAMGKRQMGVGEGVAPSKLLTHWDGGLQPVPSLSHSSQEELPQTPGGVGRPVHTGSYNNPVGISVSGLN